jgi:hypothetical protein
MTTTHLMMKRKKKKRFPSIFISFFSHIPRGFECALSRRTKERRERMVEEYVDNQIPRFFFFFLFFGQKISAASLECVGNSLIFQRSFFLIFTNHANLDSVVYVYIKVNFNINSVIHPFWGC